MESAKNDVAKPILWGCLLAVGMFVGAQLDDELPERLITKEGPQTEIDRLEDVIGFVKSKYGEPLNDKLVSDAAIKSIVNHLDPHSYYLEGSQFDFFNDRVNGDYSGVGIEYKVIADTVYVAKVREGTPADKAGIGAGDVIWSIDSQQVSGNEVPIDDIYSAWKSDEVEILLEVQQRGGHNRVKKNLTKEQISLVSVPIAYMIRDSIGYIKLTRFSSETYREFMEKVETLAGEGLRDLIIDVRDNPGGSLDQTVKIIDQFIEAKDRLLVYLEGTHMPRIEYHSTANVFFRIKDLVVLINENSVSASEILAGSLQDLKRATLVGRRTFGKALVQETFPLDESSAVNLSIGRYYLPSGRHIQRSYDDRLAYDDEPDARRIRGELYVQPKGTADSLSYIVADDGRQLPVGSGVHPDVFVPADSMVISAAWAGLRNRFEDFSFLRLLAMEDDEQLSVLGPDLVEHFLKMQDSPEIDRSDVESRLDSELQRLYYKYQDGELPAAQFELENDLMIKAALQQIAE